MRTPVAVTYAQNLMDPTLDRSIVMPTSRTIRELVDPLGLDPEIVGGLLGNSLAAFVGPFASVTVGDSVDAPAALFLLFLALATQRNANN